MRVISIIKNDLIYFGRIKNILDWYDWEHLLQTYKKNTKETDRVLEIGASTLERSLQFKKYCKELVGLEYEKDRIIATSEFKIELGDWQTLTEIFEPESFDIIISSHVIEHIKDDIKALNESYKILKKGGKLIFNTPNRKRLIRVFIEFFVGERKFPYWEHQREYTEQDLDVLIKNSLFRNSRYVIEDIGLRLPFFSNIFLIMFKKYPKFLRKYSNYWEVVIKKN